MSEFPSTVKVFRKDPDPSQCPEPIAIVGMGMPSSSTHLAFAHRQAGPVSLGFNNEGSQASLIHCPLEYSMQMARWGFECF